MADEFHPVLSPRVADKPDATITLSFDDPIVADKVVIQLFEVDAWGSGPSRVVEDSPRDTLIAELTGKIDGGKFILEKKDPKGPLGTKPEIHLHIHGQEKPTFVEHALPIPASALPNESGVFEIEARVSGLIKGKAKTGKTEMPTFLRNFKAGRPVVAFITGSSADSFFANADAFWKAVADGKFTLGSIEEIRSFLRTQADARGFGPWGEVNIVNHGNEFEWIVKLFRSERAVSHVHTNDLKKARSDPRFANPIPSLDTNSRLVIRGCAIGNDQALLDEIRALFGGPATVLAPKFIQIYLTTTITTTDPTTKKTTTTTNSREGFMDMFFFYVPGTDSGRRKLSVDQCKGRLSRLFPGVNDADWLPMLKKTGAKLSVKEQLDGFRHDRTETFRISITFDVTHTANKPAPSSVGRAKDFIALGRSVWTKDEDHFNTNFDDWTWEQGPLQRKELSNTVTRFARILTGNRHRIEVRREKRDASGTPVRPNLDDPTHFGRSPAAP